MFSSLITTRIRGSSSAADDFPIVTINDSGEIVGLFGTDVAGPFQGYTRVGKTYTTVMFPGSTETRVRGLNNAGVIVGRYTDSGGVVHGYMGTPQ